MNEDRVDDLAESPAVDEPPGPADEPYEKEDDPNDDDPRATVE